MEQKACIVFCRCGAGTSEDTFKEISEGLKKLDAHVYEIHDLCAFSLHEKDVLNAIGARFQMKIVVACYPRAVKNMLRQGGINFGQYDVLNFKELSPELILSKIRDEYRVEEGEACSMVQFTGLDVPAWFPVIDESACSLCGKCASFCLFGVYKFDRKSLKVVNPLACKNNCPACGRTCPTSAIMFPRLNEQTALAGAEPGKKDNKTANAGLYVMLSDRNKARKNIFRHEVMQQAEQERRKALEELKSTFIKKN